MAGQQTLMPGVLWPHPPAESMTGQAYDEPLLQAINVSRIKGNLAGLARHDATVAFFLAALDKPDSKLDVGEMLVALISILAEEKREYRKKLEL